MSQQETVTNRLVSVIQAIQLGRRTGLLTAKRGEGIILEEGTITFVKGQVTQANVGRRSGSEALNWLTTWGSCRFAFVPADTSEAAVPLTPIPSTPSSERRTINTEPYPGQRLPPFGRQTEPLRPGGREATEVRQYSGSTTAPVVPSHTRQLDSSLRIIERMGLSRTHRRLFLLIDGHRPTAELARLMGRSEDEVRELLSDLERATVIQISTAPQVRQQGL